MPKLFINGNKKSFLYSFVTLFLAIALTGSTATGLVSASPHESTGDSSIGVASVIGVHTSGSRAVFMNYPQYRAKAAFHRTLTVAVEEKTAEKKRIQKLRKLIDKANAVPKHVTKFHPNAITNARSRYPSWLAADREVKSLSSPRAYAVQQIDARGWNMRQWACLDRLWWHESNWRYKAGDSSGRGAYGIPQAAPGSKMSAAGKDWKTNPQTQIDWGLDYIENRYGTPCKAWDFWAHQAAFGDHGWGWY